VDESTRVSTTFKVLAGAFVSVVMIAAGWISSSFVTGAAWGQQKADIASALSTAKEAKDASAPVPVLQAQVATLSVMATKTAEAQQKTAEDVSAMRAEQTAAHEAIKDDIQEMKAGIRELVKASRK
jgi:hypothetical protein